MKLKRNTLNICNYYLQDVSPREKNLQYHYHKMITFLTTQGGDRMNMFRVTYEEVVTTELRIALNTQRGHVLE